MTGPLPDAGKLASLLAPFDTALTARQLTQLSAYLDLLVKWNAKINLTAVRDPEHMVTRHFGESLFAARLICEKGIPGTLIDVGSGAGFPGLPFAIYSPGTEVVLIESQQKKATFLKETGRMLDLKNLTVRHGRAEDISQRAQVVTMRAVERFEQTAGTAWGLVEQQGILALLIGTEQQAIARLAVPVAEWEKPIHMPLSASRVLLLTNPRS